MGDPLEPYKSAIGIGVVIAVAIIDRVIRWIIGKG
jgi:hypothetical protein